MFRFLLLTFSLGLASLAFGQSSSADTNVLWYAQPARSWMTEALPIGNRFMVKQLSADKPESYRFGPNLSRAQ